MSQIQILKISSAVGVVMLFYAATVYTQTTEAIPTPPTPATPTLANPAFAAPAMSPIVPNPAALGTTPAYSLTTGNSPRLDPEMRAMLMQRLQNLRLTDTEIAGELQQFGGGGYLPDNARSLTFQRQEIQRQIQDIEHQLGLPAVTASPVAADNPMYPGTTGMPGTTPGTLPPQNRNPMTGLPYPGIPNAAYHPYSGAGMGISPQNTALEQIKQGLLNDLRNLQHTLAPIPQGDPVRPMLEAQQADLLRQVQSINQQLGTLLPTPNETAGTSSPNVSLPTAMGMPYSPSVVPTTVDALTANAEANATRQAPILSRTNSAYITQLQNAERALRASGNTAMADELLSQIQQSQKLQLPTESPLLLYPPEIVNGGLGNLPSILPSSVSSAYPQPSSEITELKSTVSSLRDEVSALKEEIKTLKTFFPQLSNNNPIEIAPLETTFPAPTMPSPDAAPVEEQATQK
ncbi:MAG: hypothetical protein LBJ67_10765 [Planctomycetaceae bacterium]|jgi:hypothetical protein|nr:hypothetical protein [Planctomycetaceae bacterium]